MNELDKYENEMDPAVKQYLLDKITSQSNPLEQYSPEKYQATVADMKQRQGNLGLSQLAAGVGDALARKDSAATDNYFQDARNNIADQTIGDFNRQKAQAMANDQEQKKLRLTDPNSQDSKNFRSLVMNTMPTLAQSYGKDFDKVAAADQDSILNFGKMKANIDVRKALAESNLQAKQSVTKDMKAAQAMATGYGKRIEQSEQIFDKLADKGYSRADAGSAIGAMLPNIWRSDDSQMQEQAERNFVNAVLRKESGAAISPSEFSSAEKQYFPRAGDSADVIEQKRNNRLQVLENLKAEGGKGYEKTNLVSQKKDSQETKMINGKKYHKVDGGWELSDG